MRGRTLALDIAVRLVTCGGFHGLDTDEAGSIWSSVQKRWVIRRQVWLRIGLDNAPSSVETARSNIGHPDKQDFFHAFDDVASMT